MNTEIVYVYNLFLIIFYSITLATSLLHYFKEERRSRKLLFLMLAVYLAIFILDNSIISMTELISGFASKYNQSFQGRSFIKTAVFLSNNYCQLWLVSHIAKKKSNWWEYSLPLAIFLLMLLPLLQTSALGTYLYYLPNQLWLFYLGWKAAWAARNPELEPIRARYLQSIAKLAIFSSLLILVEDSIIIFHVDHYSLLHPYIINRNFSENLFSICICLLALRYFLKDSSLMTSDSETDISADESKHLMQNFCQDYHLTERECEICQLLLSQKHNQEIAQDLYLSVGTVKTHIHNIFIKTGVKKREEFFSLYHHFLNQHS